MTCVIATSSVLCAVCFDNIMCNVGGGNIKIDPLIDDLVHATDDLFHRMPPVRDAMSR